MYIIERVRLVQRFVFTEAQIMVRQNMDALDLVLVLCEKTTQQRDVHRSIIDTRMIGTRGVTSVSFNSVSKFRWIF